MGIFNAKCSYCNGKNLYLKRTSPTEKLGCRDCENKVKLLEAKGLNRAEILKIIKG